jgi:ATP-binding cassette subfamily B protein
MNIVIRLLSYTLYHKVTLFSALASMILGTLAGLIVPSILGIAIDEVIQSGSKNKLLILILGIMIVSLIRGITSYLQEYLAESVAQKVCFKLRNELFSKIQSLGFDFHDNQTTGNLLSRTTSDVDATRMLILFGTIRGLSAIITLVSINIILFFLTWKLALVVLSILPILIWRTISMSKKLRTLWSEVQSAIGKMTTLIQENFTGIKIIKVFASQNYETKRFEKQSSLVANFTYLTARIFASQGSLLILLFSLITVVVLWVGFYEVKSGQISPGQLVSFIFYLTILAIPVRMSGFMINTYARSVAAGQRIFEILDQVSSIVEKNDAINIRDIKGHIKFNDVFFKYQSTKNVLKNINFEIHPGQFIAIVGSSGSGKTTLMHLLPRFYDVSSGTISIDDINVSDMTIASLRNNIGIVMQDAFTFSGTLRENISYGSENASLPDIIKAAQFSELHDYIDGLPEKYNSWVGERGITLSGGQKQRLGIARTILTNPPIIILDDSTSSVDTVTEQKIHSTLSTIAKGKTTLVIAHRISTVQQADSIIVMNNGSIVNTGTHEQLLDTDNLYRRIFEIQLSN